MSAQRIPQSILEEAVSWSVRLQSSRATTAEHDAFSQWRTAHAVNERAWQEVEAVKAMILQVPAASTDIARRTLAEAAHGRLRARRRVLKALGLGALAAGVGVLATQVSWHQREVYATPVGARRRITLADGTALTLNTASDVEVTFSPLKRLVALRAGEIAIDTGRDADSITGRRPFWVNTPHGRFEAIGTSFVVRLDHDATSLHVSEGAVAAHPLSGTSVLVRAGSAVRLGADGTQPAPDLGLDPRAWTENVLVAREMRLADFAAELSRYRTAPVRCDAGVAELRISGVYQLGRADPAAQALEVLQQTLRVRVIPGPEGVLLITRG